MRYCRYCLGEITYDEVSPGYHGVCLDCDEDMYFFETFGVDEIDD